MNSSCDLFEDWQIPLEDPSETLNKNIMRFNSTFEHKNVLVSNKGNIKYGDHDKFVVDTIEVLDFKINSPNNLLNCEERNQKKRVYRSRKIPWLRDEHFEIKKKPRKLSVIRKLIGTNSSRMSSNKVLDILASSRCIELN